ncbi:MULTISPECIES: sensor histidine kinase [Paenibacillus]|uniref:histidine kinase n=1 Tax=Paenibacillus barengoltzii J12 TaxID=935846 RepID=A0ABY1M330_9BACL|nr:MULTISPECIES: sensor histidine kinase [Paenibacillus]MDU0330806.1 sensor histidine kinase [Paenibacillus sp. 3LSP]SMF64812.1 two-component system, sensor histidine kinase YesM [Paenibacillus barengoltzii J12]
MRKRLPFVSIKSKIVIICLTVIIVPILVMTVISYFSSQNQLERKYTELLMEVAKQTNIRIDEYFKEIEKISLVTTFGMNNPDHPTEKIYPIQEFLRDDSEQNKNEVYGMLMNYIMMKDQEISIYVYNLNGGQDLIVGTNQPYNYRYRPTQEEWFQSFQVSTSKMMILDTHIDRQTQNNTLAISHVRKILDTDSGTLLGFMVVSIDLDVIEIASNRLQESLRKRFTIVDESDNIIYNNDFSLIGQKFSETIRPNRTDHLMVASRFERQRWTTYLYMPKKELSAEGNLLRHNLYLLATLMLIFLAIVSILLSTVITHPLKKLMRNILLVEKGQFDQVQEIRSHDEIGHLSTRFQRMSHELKRLVERIQQEEKDKATAEIRALQSQINPHFLYNTLGSVKWIASMQQANKIVEMTDALIEMLFYAARSEDALVTVRQELDNLRNYMIIQKVRYYNRIRLEIQADEDTLDERIPKLILQPLVENAIFHGLAWKEESGTITINVERSGNDISITIQDNGVGMDDETLHSLTDSLAYAEKGEAQNIGLYNVMRRLKLHYGENHGFELKSKWGEGTTIRMVLPNLT